MAKHQRDAAKEAYWRGVLTRQAASGQSVREFCQQERLTESQLYAWRRTGQRDAPGKPGRVRSANRMVTGRRVGGSYSLGLGSVASSAFQESGRNCPSSSSGVVPIFASTLVR